VPAYPANASAAAYRQQSVLTATPGQLVVMLYDGALRFLLQASTAMGAGDERAADAKLRRAEAILDELHATLDMERGGEVASRLEGVYVFCRRRLIEARIERDATIVASISELLGELREAWVEIAA
jgi:flagellar protein FliS